MLIDAKNPEVAAWYCSYGAVPLIDTPLPWSYLFEPSKSGSAAKAGQISTRTP
jgi:hypothetical protein